MIDFAAIASRLARICFGGGRNECSIRTSALCAAAAIATLALSIAAWHPSIAHADSGASARSQAVATAPDESGATIQAYAQRILRAITDDSANKWVRYWQARAACDAAPATRRDAVRHAALNAALASAAANICARLDALIGVNPADYSPRGEDRTVGLLLNEPGAALGYTLFTGYDNDAVFLLDQLGRVAYAWHMPDRTSHAKLLDNGSLLVNTPPGIVELDPRGNKIWQYSIRGHHHDFLKMPNGNVMLLARGFKTPEETIAAGANPEFVSERGLRYDYLLEVRPAGASGGEIVWEWSTWDHLIQDFDPTKPNYGAIADHPELIDLNFLLETISKRRPNAPRDWLHANSIDYNPALDQIMLSARNFSELWIIDHSPPTQEARGHAGGNGDIGGDLLYRWGNPRAYRHGDHADQRLFWQHQTHWIPPGLPGAGNILLFNNGLEFSGDERYYSSIDEIAPPSDGYRYRRAPNSPYPPDAPIWTYTAETPTDFYAPILSGAQRLPNGNTLIVDGSAGTIFQATPDGKIVWKYVVPFNKLAYLRQGERPSIKATFPTPHGDPAHWLANAIYRAYWYPPDHPGLQALDLTPGAYIEDLPDIYATIVAAISAGDFGDPIARSDFAIYLDDENQDNRRLIYIKQPCAAEDAQTRFFLQIIPSNVRHLPAHRRENGFVSIDFNNEGIDARALDDSCIATRRLPGYPIERIRTGQYTDEGVAWQADVELGE